VALLEQRSPDQSGQGLHRCLSPHPGATGWDM